ncbi:MAG: glutamate--tRNA ligase [Acidobacteriaceae bacterium]
MQVRVRFAPSPTGHLHVGNARTALYNWLFARRHSGANILRIEDTDAERSESRFETQLLADLEWLGVSFDEGPQHGGPHAPYRQSDRRELYAQRAQQLINARKAYYCFCSADELEAERQRALAEHRSPHYSGKCRALDPADSQHRVASGETAAIRLLIPEHAIRFHDIVRGNVEFAADAVSDPIIVRSAGMPVYNYVVVIDDIEMQITHVIRGDDHLSNTPKQVALYEALGAPVPEFAHLSTILGSDRERLSKRHGATSIASFREMGVLPEALTNYLALLGWAPSGGDREIFSPQELVREFSLERVTSSPAIFDMEKLYWLNRHYLKTADPKRIEQLARAYFVDAGLLRDHWGDAERHWFTQLLALLLPSIDTLSQLTERASLLFDFNPQRALADPSNADVLAAPSASAVLDTFVELIRAHAGKLSAPDFKAIVNETKSRSAAKGKELFHPIRILLTGSHSGPEFDKLIPLIEDGSELHLPKHVLSVRERVEAFAQAR